MPVPMLTGDLDLLSTVVTLEDSVEGSRDVEASDDARALAPSDPVMKNNLRFT